MCTCPAALNKAAAALYGVNCVIKGENPQESCAEALVISFLGKSVSNADIWAEIAKRIMNARDQAGSDRSLR